MSPQSLARVGSRKARYVPAARHGGGVTPSGVFGNGSRPCPVFTPADTSGNTRFGRFARGWNDSGASSSRNAQKLLKSSVRSSAFVPPVTRKPRKVAPSFTRATCSSESRRCARCHSRWLTCSSFTSNGFPAASRNSATTSVGGAPFGT